MTSSVPSYEEQQEQLKRSLEGDPDQGIRIEIPKEPEVDPIVYKDVEALLFRGFIVAHININGERFVFKSLNQHEFGLLSLAAGDTPNSKFWDVFLAHCVLMVDGINVIADRQEHIPELRDLFRQMPRPARDRIIRHISEINRRASVCVLVAEAYATESASRYRWAQLRGLDLTHPCVTGIQGSEHLGMNWAQLVWRAVNYYEDIREQGERDWENAKFVGSCMAGKGISKVYRQDEERRRKDKEEKFARKDAILRHVLLGEEMTAGKHKYGAPLAVARTEEELVDQLERSLRGEKDFHDLIVDAHEKHTRDQNEAQRQQLRDIVQKHEEEYDGKMLRGTTELVGLTQEEVRERIEKRKIFEAQAAAKLMVYPDLLDEKQNDFSKKWGLGNEPGSGLGTTDADASRAVPVDLPGPARTPRFRR